MSSELAKAYIIGLFLATDVSVDEEKGVWDFKGIANGLLAQGEFPATFKFVVCIGVSGYGEHTFRYEIRDHDGNVMLQQPEKTIDLKFGRMYWITSEAILETEGQTTFELAAYLNGAVASLFPVIIV